MIAFDRNEDSFRYALSYCYLVRETKEMSIKCRYFGVTAKYVNHGSGKSTWTFLFNHVSLLQIYSCLGGDQ